MRRYGAVQREDRRDAPVRPDHRAVFQRYAGGGYYDQAPQDLQTAGRRSIFQDRVAQRRAELFHGERWGTEPGPMPHSSPIFRTSEPAAGTACWNQNCGRDCNSWESGYRFRGSGQMSVPVLRESETSSYRIGQFVAGSAVLLVVLALIVGIAKAPWGFAEPVVRYVGERPLLDALAKAAIVAFGFVPVHVLLLIWWERKFAGWMQTRLGPMHVGWKGLGQTAADAVKLLTKEDIIPAKADRTLFIIAPYLVFVPTIMTFMVLPFSMTWVGYDYPLAVLYVIGVSTVSALGIMSAGWGGDKNDSVFCVVRARSQ